MTTITYVRAIFVWAFCGAAILYAQHPPAIASISVCSPDGAGGAGSCPSGSFDTHQIVLAPDGSGQAINTYVSGTMSDEHSSAFSPGQLGNNNDYLFFVAAGTKLDVSIGSVVLSGGSGPDKNGQWTFDIPKTDGYGAYSSGFGDVFHAPIMQGRCPVVADGNPAHQDSTFDLEYAAPGSIVKDPTSPAGNLLMIYEGVNPCAGDNGGTKQGNGNPYISAGVATSMDYGQTWAAYRAMPTFSFVALPDSNKTQGPDAPNGALGSAVCMGNNCSVTPPAAYGRYPALMPPASLAAIIATGQSLSSGISDAEPSAFVDDVGGGSTPYLYLPHGYIPGDLAPALPDGRKGDLALARAQLNGGSAPLTFFKWDGKAFSSQGVQGTESAILPDGSFANCGASNQGRSQSSINYVEPTEQYVLLFVCSSPGDPANAGAGKFGSAWFYSTSYDLSDPTLWSTPQEVLGSWSVWDNSDGCPDYKGWYPSLMSLDNKPGHLSTTGYIFYLWGCLGGSSTGTPPQRQFSSRMFTITTGRIPPMISVVANAEGENRTIAPNTWVEIKGSNLAPANDSRTWTGSDFANNQMPTQLDGVSATVNGKNAFVYYISANQVNILTPPDAINGPVDVVLKNNGAVSTAYTAQAEALSPSFFVFDGTHVAAVHSNGGDIGPATLYPGMTTPAKSGETVVIFANGFGSTSTQVVSGSSIQSGSLSPMPVVKIGGITANVQFAGLVAPGEFQFNVVVPENVPDGDQPIVATYNGATTQTGAVITIQN